MPSRSQILTKIGYVTLLPGPFAGVREGRGRGGPVHLGQRVRDRSAGRAAQSDLPHLGYAGISEFWINKFWIKKLGSGSYFK